MSSNFQKKQNIVLYEQHDNSSPLSPYIKH